MSYEPEALIGSEKVGSYRFRLQDGFYSVSLDLRGIPSQHYENIAMILGPKFREISFPAYTR